MFANVATKFKVFKIEKKKGSPFPNNLILNIFMSHENIYICFEK